ncbi:MAG: hypothetical protein GY811_04900 [Myxococcales bacterium]|nr:hypothetical protein [Myxococcales bacterium]
MVASYNTELVTVHWCVAVFKEIPGTAQDEGLVLAEGFEQDEPPEATELDYMMLFRTVAVTESDACSNVREALSEMDAEPTMVEGLDPDGLAISRAERKATRKLQAGDVSAKALFVGFKKECADAQRAARSVIQESIIRPSWKFWG